MMQDKASQHGTMGGFLRRSSRLVHRKQGSNDGHLLEQIVSTTIRRAIQTA